MGEWNPDWAVVVVDRLLLLPADAAMTPACTARGKAARHKKKTQGKRQSGAHRIYVDGSGYRRASGRRAIGKQGR